MGKVNARSLGRPPWLTDGPGAPPPRGRFAAADHIVPARRAASPSSQQPTPGAKARRCCSHRHSSNWGPVSRGLSAGMTAIDPEPSVATRGSVDGPDVGKIQSHS
jgi:hypothetical protein